MHFPFRWSRDRGGWRVATLVVLGALGASCAESTKPAAGPPARLAIVAQPDSGVAGAPLAPSLSVVVQDSQGRTVNTNLTVLVTIAAGTGIFGAHLRGVTAVDATDGTATFSTLSIDSAGSGYVLTAAASGVASASTASLSVAAGPPTALRLIGQPSGTTGASLAPGPKAVVCDSVGNRVSTVGPTAVTVALKAGSDSSGAVLRGTTVQTTSGGVATFPDLSLNLAGWGYVLVATAPGLTAGLSAPFSVRLAATMVSTGFGHTCIVAVGGAAYCWGDGSAGQLGTGSLAPTYWPSAVAGGLVFASVSAGGYHTCGLTTSGAAYCWGDNSSGQLGDSTLTSRSVPVPVSGGLKFTSLSAGSATTCGIATDGSAHCWGDGSYSQLGNGMGGYPTLYVPAPVAVNGGLTFTAIRTYVDRVCGIATGGAAYCWGMLGVTLNLTPTPAPVAVPGGFTFSALGDGDIGAPLCGVTTANEARCWGYNLTFVLQGWNDTSSVPRLMAGLPAATAVSAGGFQACAISATGAAYCWGQDFSGNLGDGGPSSSSSGSAVAVAGGLTLSSISTARWHTCALAPPGVVYCWGMNASGQLGTPVAAYGNSGANVPQKVLLF